MGNASSEWTVRPHKELSQLTENLWHCTGALPKLQIRRRMAVARMAGGGLVIHSAIALNGSEQANLEALGPVAFVLVPNGWHRLDAAAYAARYPDAKILCPPGSRRRVEKAVSVNGTYADFPADDAVSLELLDGLNQIEGVMRVRSEQGVTLVFNDAIFNVPHGRGVGGLLFRALGSTGGPKVTRIMKLFAVKDEAALGRHLKRLADTPDLTRIVPGHGGIMNDNPADVLRQVASALG